MQVELTRVIKTKDGKQYTNFYLTLPSGSRVGIKPSYDKDKGAFWLLKEYATLYRPDDEK